MLSTRARATMGRTVGVGVGDFRSSFQLRSVFDTLPSSVNLHQFGLVENQIASCADRERDNGAHSIRMPSGADSW